MFDSLKKKKFTTIINELECQANKLNTTYTEINDNWNKSYNNSDPKLSELIENICSFGELCGLYNHYYKIYDAYPIIESDSEYLINYAKIANNNEKNKFKATKYAIVYLNQNLNQAKNSLDKMIELRKNNDLFSNPIVENLIFETYKTAVAAEFKNECSDDKKLRKNILTKCIEIYSHIQLKLIENPDYKYSNKYEYEKLRKNIRTYEFSSKYAQFSSLINDTVKAIDEHYIYSKKIDEVHKNRK